VREQCVTIKWDRFWSSPTRDPIRWLDIYRADLLMKFGDIQEGGIGQGYPVVMKNPVIHGEPDGA